MSRKFLEISRKFLEISRKGLYKLGFPEVYVGPERFKKLREACRKNFHLVAPPKTSVVTTYDQKTKKVNEY